MRRGLWLILLLLLVACGGGDTPNTPNNPNTPNTPNTPPPSAAPGSISGLLIAPGTLDEPEQTSQAEVVPGEVIVKFKNDLMLQSLSAGGTRLQAVKALAMTDARLYRASNLSQEETRHLATELSKRIDVEYAHPNWILQVYKRPDDEFYGAQWHYEAMNLPAAWDIEDGSSREITIAVVDSGIVNHPDLALRRLPGYDFISDPAIAGDGNGRDNNPQDEGGESGFHGSHVAGTIGAETDDGAGVAGVNWNARILPVRALGVTGGGTFTDILEGLVWSAGFQLQGVSLPPAPSPSARVINLSLGGNIGGVCPPDAASIFQQLAAEGIIIVVAAGNANEDMSTTFPANCANTITVGATGPTGARAPYSNFGDGIEVMAPGGDITKVFTFNGRKFPAGVLSTVLNGSTPDFTFYQGTSMASPHIAGLVSLMLARDPSLTFSSIVSRLQNAATPLSSSACGTGGPASDCGAGFVDAAAALSGTSGGGGTPPTAPPTINTDIYAFAFYCLTTTCFDANGRLSVDESKSVSVAVEQTKSAQPYTVDDLPQGLYIMAAWQDIDGNVEVDDSDPFGVFPTPVPLSASQDRANINIFLEAVSATLKAPASRNLSQQALLAAKLLQK
jgi:serine protease